MHKNFIVASGGRARKEKIQKMPSPQVTKQFILERKPLKEIAAARKLTIGTIIDHIEQLLKEDSKLDVVYLKTDAFTEVRFKKIADTFAACFAKTKEYRLGPAQALLGKSCSYDELRLARLFLSH